MGRKLLSIILILSFTTSIQSQELTKVWYDEIDILGEVDDAIDILNDADGYIYVLGNYKFYEGGITLIKYTPNGNIVWTQLLEMENGLKSNDFVLSNNSLYIVGYINIGGIQDDLFIVKFNLEGDTIWTRSFQGTLYERSELKSVVCDTNENIYATGYKQNSSHEKEYFTIKLSSIGDSLWTRTHGATYNNNVFKVLLDNELNVIVTGYEKTIKYNNSGTLIWESSTGAIDFAIDSLNNIYLTKGNLTTCLSSAGDTIWTYQYPEAIQEYKTNSILLDSDGYVIVSCNNLTGSSSDFDIVTIKLTSTGDTLWTRSFTSPINEVGHSPDIVRNMKLDFNDNIYLTGTSEGMVILKYNNNGDFLWQKNYQSVDSLSDDGFSILIDSLGNVTAIGNSVTLSSYYYTDIIVLNYSQNICCVNFRGNIDNSPDDVIDISDLIYLVAYSFQSGDSPPCMDEADVDGSGGLTPIDISDIIFLVTYMFQSGDHPAVCPY